MPHKSCVCTNTQTIYQEYQTSDKRKYFECNLTTSFPSACNIGTNCYQPCKIFKCNLNTTFQ